MKEIIFIILVSVLFACNSESASDCLQTAGKMMEQEVEVAAFTKILVNENVELILKQGNVQKVAVQSGENLLNDIKVEVVSGQLILSDENSCNYFRDYGITKVFVTAPNITEIRSSTQFDIKSDGILNYPNVTLFSEDYRSEYQTVGDFDLHLNSIMLRLVFNNLSNVYISGNVESLNINFASGNCRFEGQNLIAQNVSIYHRSSNDIMVNPIQSLKGDIFSTGNVIAVNHPPVVEVTEHYRGKLVFGDRE